MRDLKPFTKALFGKIFFCFLLGLFIMSCEKDELNNSTLETANASVKALNTVKITSTGMNFDAPDEIPSGWNTFSYHNKGHVPHFFFLASLPEGITLEMYKEQVTLPFNNILKIMRGEAPDGPTDLPEWFGPHLYSGGSGLLDPGMTAVTSLNLEEGNYLIECYVKTPGGDFHSVIGMLDEIRVTSEDSKAKEPKAQANISIDASGLYLNDEISRPGNHTFSVDFAEGSTADVHLVRIEDPVATNSEVLKEWIYWANNVGQPNEGLMTPAPDGLTFLGGVQELFNGGSAYFQAVLKPGTYALISEVPYDMIDSYYQEFTIE